MNGKDYDDSTQQHGTTTAPNPNPFGYLRRFIYSIVRLEIKLRDSCGITILIVSDVAQEEGMHVTEEEDGHNTSLAGRFCGLALNFPLVKLLGRLFVLVHLLLQNCILLKFSTGVKNAECIHIETLNEIHIFFSKKSSLLELGKIYNQKMTHRQVIEILNCMCQRISEYKESQLQEASAYDAMLQAAKHGIIEFIDAMRKANPDLLWAIDKNKKGIFSHAILNRRKNVFRLINDVNGRKEIIKCRADAFGNTLLHLAGYLGPSIDRDRKSGAALQMQRELQWFKAVEKIGHPKCKEAKNADGKKPRELFSESHEEMVKAGEKWAKDTASSFTLVGTLITSIMFAAAFTVPGGNNQDTGVPIFLLHDILAG